MGIIFNSLLNMIFLEIFDHYKSIKDNGIQFYLDPTS